MSSVDKKYRHECKYLLNAVDAESLRTQVAVICKLDSHIDERGYYNIRSAYFDTFDDLYLRENQAGVNVRHKYRIRFYNFENSFIKLERKETENGLKHKASCRIYKNQVDELLHGNFLFGTDSNQELINEMSAEHLLHFLQPKVIVDYRRIPYVYPIGNVRITFDYDITGGVDFERFFSVNLPLRRVMDDNSVVLEVKYDDILPSEIRRLLNKYSKFNAVAFSKYALARERE